MMAVTLESLKKSVGKKNSKSKIFAWLADLELAAGDVDSALQRINGGLTLYPNDIAAKLVRSKALFQKELFEDCVKECESILVMDPFNLAAQKIMGDAYDKLGNEVERNLCYRRFHDMDPLNKFWKDEYDVVPEAAAAAALSEADFGLNLTEDDESLDLGDDSLFESSSSSSDSLSLDDAGSSLGGSLFEKSREEDAESENEVVQDTAAASSFTSTFLDEEPEPVDAPAAPESIDDDPFAALAAMLPNNDAADDAAMDELSASLESVMDSIKSDGSEKKVEEFPADENVSGDDVNAALSDMFGLEDDLEAEESSAPKSADFTSIDIDEAAEENATKVFETPAPAADKPLSVDDAFDSIFGEDELPEEPVVEKLSAEPAVEQPALEQPAASVEDKPLSVDSAFDSIFGEDELPEELPAETASVEESPAVETQDVVGEWTPDVTPSSSDEGFSFDKSADLHSDVTLSDDLQPAEPAVEQPALEQPAVEQPAASVEDKPLSVDSAFDSIFGEDELPEELPAETASVEESPAVETQDVVGEWTPDVTPSSSDEGFSFDKSADLHSDVTLSDDLQPAEPAVDQPALEQPAVEQPAASVEDKPLSVDSAFDSIFGEDELPEELPAETASVEESPAVETQDVVGEWTPDVTPSSSDEGFSFDKSADLHSDVTLSDDLQPAEPAVEQPALEQPAVEQPAASVEDKPLSVDSAFDSIFGEDELPEESPAEQPKFVSEVDVPTDPVIASPMDFVTEESSEVGNAFDNIFGADDDLPEEKPAAAHDDSEQTLVEKVDQAESELELPKATAEDVSGIAQEMGGAFASMFGEDDDLDLPDVKSPAEETPAESTQSTSAALEESFDNLFGSDDDLELPSEQTPVAGNPDLSSLESEVSGAFKGLFDMDDDSLAESETKPSNSGVDFLMSGDSDDEISAGLIKNPEAPLNRGTLNLDDSMGTRTLAEIYFDQGLYGEALKMYQELVQREPNDQELIARKNEIEKIYRDKFGGNA